MLHCAKKTFTVPKVTISPYPLSMRAESRMNQHYYICIKFVNINEHIDVRLLIFREKAAVWGQRGQVLQMAKFSTQSHLILHAHWFVFSLFHWLILTAQMFGELLYLWTCCNVAYCVFKICVSLFSLFNQPQRRTVIYLFPATCWQNCRVCLQLESWQNR